ncbi:hypothetical protein SAMD00019534_077820 [Acytostelium subglobosum LB1]|uniref:hypothetical protein n=1 Tax=Acytostelium subglobosum LB1 TaxID=1410327 RepID=UPI00064521C5|nr:hypothetical protein SAMD00019534_077820 [Acytostelium subglobosum LB1]GAM24607.1 hypothetical protein SAMD00019534_077820 [Acytostelium subglobosum LB1]|eukprot:XP_012752276.1 hypothetical protein SAMD00019534_077820 [Acytostelium subglobosum LB1]
MFNYNSLSSLIVVFVSLLLLTSVDVGNGQYLVSSYYVRAGCMGPPTSTLWKQLNRCKSNTISVLSSSTALQTTAASTTTPSLVSSLVTTQSNTNPIPSLVTSSSKSTTGVASLLTNNALPNGLPTLPKITASAQTDPPVSIPVVVNMYCVDPTCGMATCMQASTIVITGQCVPNTATPGQFVRYSIANVQMPNMTRDSPTGTCYAQTYQTVCNVPPFIATQDANNVPNIGYKVNCTRTTYNYYQCMDVECTDTTLVYNKTIGKCAPTNPNQTPGSGTGLSSEWNNYASFFPPPPTPAPGASSSTTTTTSGGSSPTLHSNPPVEGDTGGASSSTSVHLLGLVLCMSNALMMMLAFYCL